MSLPPLEEQAKYGMLVENPLWKLAQYKKGKLQALVDCPNVQECPECHLYTEGTKHEQCVNCGLKLTEL